MVSISLIVTAIGLGIAYAAAPGAVNTEAIRRGFSWGARSALLVEIGSLIGDSVWAILALTGVTLLTRYLAVQMVLGIIGGFFLLRLAWLALSEAFARQQSSSGKVASTRGDFATGVVFGLANPVGLAFWSGIGSSVLASGMTGWNFGFSLWASFAALCSGALASAWLFGGGGAGSSHRCFAGLTRCAVLRLVILACVCSG